MGFAVLPAQVPEIASVYDAYFAAFADDPVTRAFFPNASKEDLTNPESEFRKAHTTHVFGYWQTPGSVTQYTLKCVDSDTGKIVGMALWDVYITPSDWKPPGVSWLSGKEKEKAEANVLPLWQAREDLWDNQRYIYCHVIAVRPEYQRRGVGRVLMEYGTQLAEQLGLPIYIESSSEGLRLYEKLGCRKLKRRIGVIGGDLKDETEQCGDAPKREPTLMVWFGPGKENSLPKKVQAEL